MRVAATAKFPPVDADAAESEQFPLLIAGRGHADTAGIALLIAKHAFAIDAFIIAVILTTGRNAIDAIAFHAGGDAFSVFAKWDAVDAFPLLPLLAGRNAIATRRHAIHTG
ncbi:MAG: hypothetical protein OXE80_00285 [Gammaproteobacteria bacterium]|nr:hypothetical protein [Gammaproteobacteria bacterium]